MTVNHETEITQAKQLLRHQDFAAGLAIVQDILYEDPDCLEALCLLGVVHTETGHQSAALKALQFYFDHGGASPEAWEAYGCAQLRLHNWDQAEAALLKVLELNPDMASSWRNIGVLYSQTGDKARSYEALKKAAALDPDDLFTMYALSSAHLQFGELEAARSILVRLAADNIPPDIRDFARDALSLLDHQTRPRRAA